MPPGALLSPPDSATCSSDDEERQESRGRPLENLAELQAAIRTIEQQRVNSEAKSSAPDMDTEKKHLTVVVPSDTDAAKKLEQVLTNNSQRRINHNRSNTESAVFLDLRSNQPETPSTGSEEEYDLSDEEERSRRKPPMVRKKSGELVRPALRGSSARRRPSSMPGTPTFSKAVHFDSHLEHVRHFLQVDRPLAVSAGSSPVDSYESDTEFPFGDETNSRSHPWEWEIITSNFPAPTTQRLAQPVRLERVFLSADNKTLVGTVAVANLAFHKHVVARFTLDYWKTTSEVVAEYNNDIRQQRHTDNFDRFNFNIKLADLANLEAKTMFFCIKYAVNGQEYWDNNNFTNFQVDFRKKPKLQNGKRGSQGASSRPSNALPRSHKKPIPSRPKSMPVAFDDFADGFDTKYNPADFKQPVNELLGESHPPLRLKGVKSAVTLPSETRKTTAVHHTQLFGHRYDFGASLSAAIQGSGAPGERGGIYMKPSTKNITLKSNGNGTSSQNVSPRSTVTDSPLLVGSQKPVLASQSYNELLDKYCFFGSAKSSPQLKDGTVKSNPYENFNDDGYALGSAESTASNSPLMMVEKKPSPPRSGMSSLQITRSTSPAPMTGFATGTSSMYPYPYQVYGGLPFQEAHSATAIRG